ncbi:MAG: hypothetical protein QGG54_04445 [Gammaproteobacteria bacterium]|nr:hypothetical protein [Gammaproteobacteria bacterium]MDP6537892.1 hypothetical protein [Gammaproteobacteria bacterium]MDP6731907.1 hypothetical protein [Gammaproteobacteria bacterium]
MSKSNSAYGKCADSIVSSINDRSIFILALPLVVADRLYQYFSAPLYLLLEDWI